MNSSVRVLLLSLILSLMHFLLQGQLYVIKHAYSSVWIEPPKCKARKIDAKKETERQEHQPFISLYDRDICLFQKQSDRKQITDDLQCIRLIPLFFHYGMRL